MADFKVTFAEALISSGVATATAAVSIANTSKAFLIPAVSPFNTAGIGRETGTYNNSFVNISALASIQSTTAVLFDDNDTSIARNNRCGVYLVEYTGPAGGANEIAVRAITTVTLTSGVDLTKDTGLIAVATAAKCVPFMTVRCNHNSGNYTSHFGDVDIIDQGGGNVVARVTRSANSGDMVCQIYVVEFLGSNWTVQKVTHQFAASNVDEDDTITSVGNVANAFTYSSFRPTSVNLPSQQNVFAYLAAATTLRNRCLSKAPTGQTLRTWIISNAQLAVTRYGTPDGTADITATTVDPEVQNVTVTAVPDLTKALVLSYAGSDSVSASNSAAGEWLNDLSTTTNVRMRRSNSVGNTEYVHQVIDLSAMNEVAVNPIGVRKTGGRHIRTTKVFEVSPSGRVKWKDYIPVKQATDVNTKENTYDQLGAIVVDKLLSVAGLVEWVDYTPVVTVTDPESGLWRTDNLGFIRVMYTS